MFEPEFISPLFVQYLIVPTDTFPAIPPALPMLLIIFALFIEFDILTFDVFPAMPPHITLFDDVILPSVFKFASAEILIIVPL